MAETMTADAVVEGYGGLIQKEAVRCARKLPPGSAYDRVDLFQEGVAQALYAAPRFRPEKGRFSTYLTIAVVNRFSLILRKEWRKSQTVVAYDPEALISAAGGEAPGQPAVDLVVDLERLRYRKLLYQARDGGDYEVRGGEGGLYPPKRPHGPHGKRN